MKNRSLAVTLSLLISPLAFALPQNGQVAAGSATISSSTTQTTVTQTSQNAVINWGSFDTASNESVQFTQPNATSITLNRITSGTPTNFAGSLTANGRIFIVNPSGIVFAKGSKVDVAGLIATTADINDNDFMNGNYKFTLPQGSGSSTIINNGTLTAEDKGVIALIAPNVQNGDSGIIQANCGTVNLSTGATFVVDFNGDNLINFDASSTFDNGGLQVSGKILADGGKIIMTNNALSQTLDDVINITGVIEAGTAKTGEKGEIILEGGQGFINQDNNSGEIIATGPSRFTTTGDMGDIRLNNTQLSGPVSFSSGRDLWIGSNEGGNLIFDNVFVTGNLNIINAESNISQTAAGSIIVNGTSVIQTSISSTISLPNAGNQFKGQVSVGNMTGGIAPTSCSVTLNNSIATEIGTAGAEGVLTITSGGPLTIDWMLASNGTRSQNGHSIILSAPSLVINVTDPNFGPIDPGQKSSWLIYVPNPAAISNPSDPFFGSGPIGQVWNQPYTPSSPANIPAGNHFVYASGS